MKQKTYHAWRKYVIMRIKSDTFSFPQKKNIISENIQNASAEQRFRFYD